MKRLTNKVCSVALLVGIFTSNNFPLIANAAESSFNNHDFTVKNSEIIDENTGRECRQIII